MPNNDSVVISKRMFSFFVGTIFVLLSSVLVLMGMIWKLNSNDRELRITIQDNATDIRSLSQDIADHKKLNKIQTQTIEVLVNKLEDLSKNCCKKPTGEIIANKSNNLPAAKLQVEWQKPKCIVNGVNVCAPLVIEEEPTTQNETELHTFLPCRCA